MSVRILCVDDEPKVLAAFERQLCDRFELYTAESGAAALGVLEEHGPFAVIVSDMRMPEMDGIQFLAQAKVAAPDSVRIMLTGNADQHTATHAVNEGSIFRFLTKPCPPDTLAQALDAGIEQYRLVTAERALLEQTLNGAVKVLIDVLALANPAAFGRASRVRHLVGKLCEALGMQETWQCEIAALLSQIGCITMPEETLDLLHEGQNLKPDEAQMFNSHPVVGHDLVANIPRLGDVARIIAYQQKHYDGGGLPDDRVAGEDIPFGARVLKLALDFDTLKRGGETDIQACVTLRQRRGWYDPAVVTAADALVGFEDGLELRAIRVSELEPQMVLAEDVTTVDGALLISKGQEVTASLYQRLKNFAKGGRIQEPIRVLAPVEGCARSMQLAASERN